MRAGDTPGFVLDPRLAADTHCVCDLALCRVLLMDNALFPWLILVPRRAGLVELHELDAADAPLLWREIGACARHLKPASDGKINIGALGNIVAQLHVHVVRRDEHDAAWPGPVWGGPRAAYAPTALAAWQRRLRDALAPVGRSSPEV